MLTKKEKKALARTDLVIDNNTSTWNIRLEGPINGTYAGSFRFRCYLHPLQRIAANRDFREMIGSNPAFASETESFLAYALTQLKYRILSAPPFWSSENPADLAGDIPDENIITAVLDAALESELKYKSQIKKRKEDAVKRATQATEKLMDGKKADDSKDTEDEEEDDSEDQED